MALRPPRTAIAACCLAAAAFALLGCAPEPDAAAGAATDGVSETPSVTPSAEEPRASEESDDAPDAAAEFDRSAHSIDDPMSIWVVSNKQRALQPVDFAPTDLVTPEGVENEFAQPLRAPAARAVEALVGAAAGDGIDVRIISAYRDYATQVALYDGYVARDGQEAADTYSARPGHSEHQTGLAVDFDDHGACYLAACFGETPAGLWLAEHAAEHGFVVRYPEGAQEVTGFVAEPWHFRYVGPELALRMQDQGIATLEEFFELPSAPGYAR